MNTPRALLALPLLLALAAPARTPAQHAGDAVRVNGVGISNEKADVFVVEYLARKGRNPQTIRHPDAYRQYRREALEQLVDEELLWQEAKRLGLVATPEQVSRAVEAARAEARTPAEFARRLDRAGLTEATYPEHARRQASIRNLLEGRTWKGISLSDEEVSAWYRDNPDRFRTPEEVKARHILVPADGAAPPEARARARRAAEQLRVALLSGADFASLARERSRDKDTADKGGDLGWVKRGTMVPEFEAAAFALDVGAISPVVETVYGFHLVQVEARRGGELTPEADVREEIRTYLLGEKRRAAARAAVGALREKATIEWSEPR